MASRSNRHHSDLPLHVMSIAAATAVMQDLAQGFSTEVLSRFTERRADGNCCPAGIEGVAILRSEYPNRRCILTFIENGPEAGVVMHVRASRSE